MAAEKYIRDLSKYLMAGNLSDLTLFFGDKKWPIHKAIVCSHSKWFQKAVTTGMQESETGVITLKDEPEFADAIDCMVSYFYEAAYDVSKYEIPESLLHAQVATLADKYDCASLCELAKGLFAKTVRDVGIQEWVAVAELVYKCMPSGQPVHTEFRKLVIAAVVDRPAALNRILKDEGIIECLRSDAELATDLLLATHSQHTHTIEDTTRYYLVCLNCSYRWETHDPSGLNGNSIVINGLYCPQCRKHCLSKHPKQIRC